MSKKTRDKEPLQETSEEEEVALEEVFVEESSDEIAENEIISEQSAEETILSNDPVEVAVEGIVERNDQPEKQKIAVFYQHWIEATQFTPGISSSYLHSWKKNDIVYLQSDIQRLIDLNAPIKVYVEDGIHGRSER